MVRSTIAARVDLLLAAGLVTPTGEAVSTGGRPPATFAFNPGARVVLAVDLGATHVRLAVTDLAGTVLSEHHEPLAIADGPDVVLDRVATIGLTLISDAGRRLADLAGVGVGLPGPVEHSSGRPINPPIMPGWDDADVPGHLGQLLGVPVLVDNDVNIMALGEHATEYPQVEHLLFVKVATGIGAGIISDGQILRGAQGAPGVSGTSPPPEDRTCRADAGTPAASRPSQAGRPSQRACAHRASRSPPASTSSLLSAAGTSWPARLSEKRGARSVESSQRASACSIRR